VKQRPTLSFCITTKGPPERVRALLSLLRPHVDEIVLAVDRRRGGDTLDACADLADRRLTFELDGTASRLIGWVLAQCSGDWILRLDDDEVPSASLLASLPELVTDRRVEQVLLERRWLFPDAGHHLTESPWRWEFLPRLLRNSPGSWRFRGRMHDHGDLAGEQRLVDAPFYHLDLVLNSLDDRRRKSLRYEARRPGLVLEGLPVNALYVPEDVRHGPGAPVPAADRRLLEAVLRAGVVPTAPPPVAPVHHATDAEIDSHLVTTGLTQEWYRAEIRLVDPPPVVGAGTTRRFLVAVRNRGDALWPAGDEPARPIRLGYRWRDTSGAHTVHEGRTLLPESVPPGRESLVLVWASTPVDEGAYRFEVDLVHEHVRWFDAPATTTVEVAPMVAPAGAGGEVSAEWRRRELERLRASVSTTSQELAAARAFRQSRRYRAAGAVLSPMKRLRSARSRRGG
jgi:hypothetical protein